MEENNNNNQAEEKAAKMKQWLQDNLRIIISVIIVILIAGGIYSYSKRTEGPTTQDQTAATQDQTAANQNQTTSPETTSSKNQNANQSAKNSQKNNTGSSTSVAQNNAQPGVSQETDSAFVETAARGQGLTQLARRALANYLEKNPDSSLTPEHKIYIEDYLRKNVGYTGGIITTHTSVAFSKDLIKNAITKSKTLTASQLKNLHKYAVLVPSLS